MKTDAEIVATATAFLTYPDGLHPTIRGKADIVAFGRALLADVEGKALLRANPPAAPDLLKSLQAVVDQWERQKRLFPVLERDGWMDLAVANARMAIAKANPPRVITGPAQIAAAFERDFAEAGATC
jgi:hypothetical protein